MTHNHLDEETIVDYTLDHLTIEDRKRVEIHLFTCEKCEQKWQGWRQVLSEEPSSVPSPGLKQSITAHIENQTSKHRKSAWRRIPVIVTSVAVLFILSMTFFQLKNSGLNMNGKQQGYIMAQHDEIPEQTFMENPDTGHLHAVPVTNNKNISGDVWLNNVTNEMVIHVDGLVPLNANDYQLWLVHANDNWNSQLLNLRNGSIRVYYKGSDIKYLKYIKVSIEPRGGSLAPTGPETFHYDLH